MLYQIFLSPKVKPSAIISNKHGIYELPHELSKDLRLRILGNSEYQENLKTSFNYSLVPSLTPKMKILSILAKNCGKIEIEIFL